MRSSGVMLTPEELERALCRPLPGHDAQQRMAPSHREFGPPAGTKEHAVGGVLLLLYPGKESNELFLVLTVRTDSVAFHKGQVSLPGGGSEPGDMSIFHTALREASEEVGVRGEDIRNIGSLTPLYIGPSNFYVYPCVAYIPYHPSFVLQTTEVSKALEVPVAHFLDEKNVIVENWQIEGALRRVPYFDVYGHKVWGATAIILSEFAAVLEGLEARDGSTGCRGGKDDTGPCPLS